MAYKLKLKKQSPKKRLLIILLIVVLGLSLIASIVWLVWLRPIQQQNNIDNFEECRDAGYPIQDSYPEVCTVPNGKRFPNPTQQAAHQASLLGEQTIAPPSDPSRLYLDIEEWGVRIPLTEQTFDMIYTYIEDGISERVMFTFKRLVNVNACRGDAGLTLTRSKLAHMPPFSDTNPAPVAQVKDYYFYAESKSEPCYDPQNPAQAAIVQQISGEKTLPATVTALLANMQPTP